MSSSNFGHSFDPSNLQPLGSMADSGKPKVLKFTGKGRRKAIVAAVNCREKRFGLHIPRDSRAEEKHKAYLAAGLQTGAAALMQVVTHFGDLPRELFEILFQLLAMKLSEPWWISRVKSFKRCSTTAKIAKLESPTMENLVAFEKARMIDFELGVLLQYEAEWMERAKVKAELHLMKLGRQGDAPGIIQAIMHSSATAHSGDRKVCLANLSKLVGQKSAAGKAGNQARVAELEDQMEAERKRLAAIRADALSKPPELAALHPIQQRWARYFPKHQALNEERLDETLAEVERAISEFEAAPAPASAA